MIRMEGLRVTFGHGTPLEKEALRGIDLSIPDGTFATIIGSNGSGKSTLLSALAGDIAPTAGRILIGDADVTGQPTARRAARVARVFQDPLAGSCGELTIEENLALAAARGKRRGFAAALRPARRAQFRERVGELGLGLEDRLGDRMALLSGGQRQAVALVMATLSPSRILLLDEHTAALDPGMAEFVMQLTEALVTRHGLTTLMVTHSMRQALEHGSRTIMMHEGRIAFDVDTDRRAGLTVGDLLNLFREQRGAPMDDNTLLME